MPYIAPRPEEDPNNPVRLSSAPGGAVGASSVVSAPRTSSGSGFTNINAFLSSQANQAGGQQLGAQVAGDITREVNEAEGAISSGRAATAGQIQGGVVNFNEGDVGQTIQTGQATEGTRRMLAGTFTGPTSLAAAGQRQAIDREAQQAEERAQLAQTSGGRAEYLRQLTGRPVSAGVARLNNAFLNTNEAGVQQIQGQARRAGGIAGQVQAAEADVSRLAEQARATNAATREQALGRINQFIDTRTGELDTQAANRRTELTAAQQAQQNYLRSLALLGEGRMQAGGSGGLVPNTPEGRARALSAAPPAPAPAPAPVPAPAPTPQVQTGPIMAERDTGRMRIQQFKGGDGEGRARIPRFDDGYYVAEPEEVISLPAETTFETTSAPAPAPAPMGPPAPSPLMEGYERLGLTAAQARELQTAIETNKAAGGANIDLTQYLTLPNVTNFGRANVLSQEEAARLNSLAALTGRQGGYTATNVNTNSTFDVAAAIQALTASRDAALAARPPAPPPAPVAPPPPPPPPPPAPAPNPVDEWNNWWASQGGGGGDASDGGGVSSASDGSGADGGIGGTAGSGNDGGDGDGPGGVGVGGEGGTGEGPGGDGGGGGGGKIICSAMNELYGLDGSMNRVWINYSNTKLTKEHQVGYHFLFQPLVRYAFKSGNGLGNRIVRRGLEWMAINRTRDIIAETTGSKRHPLFFLRVILEPAVAQVGKLVLKFRKDK